MATYRVNFIRVITNGPFAYVIVKDGVGQKSADNITAANLLSSISTDIGALTTAAGETVDSGVLNISASV